MTTTRVLLVDDDALVRAGLTMMLKEAPDIEVVAEAEDGHQALAVLEQIPVDLVLMDIRMPGLDGLSAMELIRSRASAPDVVVLTTFDADSHVHRALSAGAAGYLLKDTPPEQIVESIRRIAAGEPVLSPAVLRGLIDRAFSEETTRSVRSARARAQLALLNARELEVAKALGQGQTNAEIAVRLYLSVPTIKTHVSSAMAKLDVSNRVQLALLVHEADLASDQR